MKLIKLFKHPLAFALIAGLILTLLPPANAGPSASIPPANSLSVYVEWSGGQRTLVHEYSASELEWMSGGDVHYSSIDNLPTPVLTIGRGVFIRDLVDDAGTRAGDRLDDFAVLSLNATDGWNRTYTRDELYQTRYHYEGLFAAGLIYGRVADPDAVGPGVPVEPMLSVNTRQHRMATTGPFTDFQPERFTFCIGMLPGDLTSNVSTTMNYGRGVNEMVITMARTITPGAVPVAGVSITSPSGGGYSLRLGDTVQMTAAVTPSDATNKNIKWSSGNPSVATVTEDGGLVQSISAGATTITAASAENPQLFATIAVTVVLEDVRVTGISLTPVALALDIGETRVITAAISPSNATNNNITWSSGNAAVAAVDENGNVTGRSAGTAVITAETDDGGFRASASVTVAGDGAITNNTGLSVITSRPDAAINAGQASDESARLAAQAVANVAAASSDAVISDAAPPVTVTVAEANTVAALTMPGGTDTTRITTMAVLNSDGSLTPVPTRVNPDGSVTVLVSGTAVLVPLSAGVDFTDIDFGQQYINVTNEINRAASRMIINGRGGGIFDPAAQVTNQEAATMFLRAIGVPVEFTTAMGTAESRGLVGAGVDGGSRMTRSATARMIVGALRTVGMAPSISLSDAAAVLAQFTDLGGLSNEERIAMAVCVELGIFQGAGDGLMNPDSTLQRSQMASLAVRLQGVILGS